MARGDELNFLLLNFKESDFSSASPKPPRGTACAQELWAVCSPHKVTQACRITVFQSSVMPALDLAGHLYSLLPLHVGQMELVACHFEDCPAHFGSHLIPFYFQLAFRDAHLLPPADCPASYTFLPPLPVQLLSEQDLVNITSISAWATHDLGSLISFV